MREREELQVGIRVRIVVLQTGREGDCQCEVNQFPSS
jgi:hypothetical protein